MRQPARSRLLRILRTQSKSRKTQRMRGVMKEMLLDAGMEVQVINKQIFARKGNADHMPVIVAHADTVHDIVPTDRYRVAFETVDGQVIHYAFDPKTGKQRGVGGDDKCGLWIAQEIARNMENVGVIITVDEEIGCIGAKRVTSDQIDHATVLIQADRRGKDDAIIRANQIDISSKEWQEHVKKGIDAHGYHYSTFGMGTDVAAMHNTKAAQVSAINLSAAYFDPHSDNEWIAEDHLENAFELALRLAQESSGEKWLHEAKRAEYKSSYTPVQTHYVNPEWFSNAHTSRVRGYHATHLIRDSSANRPKAPDWVYDQKEGAWVDAEKREFIAIHMLGGIVVYHFTEFRDVAQRIKASGYEVKYGEKNDHAFVTGYLRDTIPAEIAEGPQCSVEGCNRSAHLYHMVHLRWKCDTHMELLMEARNEKWLSEPPPRTSTVIEVPKHPIPIGNGSETWVDNENVLGYD